MGGIAQRTDEEKRLIPAAADAGVALVSGACAAVAVAPFLMCVDRGVVMAAAGAAPGGSLFRAIGGAASEFLVKPKVAFTSPALWMVAGVYGGTYFAKNVSDVAIERFQVKEPMGGLGKFTAVTATNMWSSILKDAAFARLFGVAAAATNAAPPVVPLASYALFAARDCLTIGGAFFVPDMMRDALVASGRVGDAAAGTTSQLVSPPLMQVVCTPMHLLALNLVNAKGASVAARVATVRQSTPAALLARSLRMLPAYGIGGILNGVLTTKGRDKVKAHFTLRRGGRASDELGRREAGARAWGSRLTKLARGDAGKGRGGKVGEEGKKKQGLLGHIEVPGVSLGTRRGTSLDAAAAATIHAGGIGGAAPHHMASLSLSTAAPHLAPLSLSTRMPLRRVAKGTKPTRAVRDAGDASADRAMAKHGLDSKDPNQVSQLRGGRWFDLRRFRKKSPGEQSELPVGQRRWRWGRQPPSLGASHAVGASAV